MKLDRYLSRLTTKEKHALAVACGVHPYSLQAIAAGRRKASVKLAQAIEEQTEGKVKRVDIRPDVWGRATSKQTAAA